MEVVGKRQDLEEVVGDYSKVEVHKKKKHETG